MSTFFIGDSHFASSKVLGSDNRPFSTTAEMDAYMVGRWNMTVAPTDHVYILGDVANPSCAEAELALLPTLKKLKGRKTLIRGNHDKLFTPEFCGLYDDIQDYLVLTDLPMPLVLMHFPIAVFWGQTRGAVHIHAHTHNRRMPFPIPGSVCVSACQPYMRFTPRTFEEIKPYIVSEDAVPRTRIKFNVTDWRKAMWHISKTHAGVLTIYTEDGRKSVHQTRARLSNYGFSFGATSVVLRDGENSVMGSSGGVVVDSTDKRFINYIEGAILPYIE